MTMSVCAPAVSSSNSPPFSPDPDSSIAPAPESTAPIAAPACLADLLRFVSHPRDVEAEKRRRFEAEWDARRHHPTRDRIAWLRSSGVIAFYGAVRCRNLAHQLTRNIEPVQNALPSEPLFEEWDSTGRLPPGLVKIDDKVQMTSPDRRHGVRVRLSRQTTRNGPAGRATRRYTPPQAVEVEDLLDALTPDQAEAYQYPPSPSASVIAAIGQLRGREGF